MDRKYKLYLKDLGQILKERALKTKALKGLNSKGTEGFAFEAGRLMAFNEMLSIDYVACGFYAAQIKSLAVSDQITIFVRSMESVNRAVVRNQIQITPDSEFGNVSITESSDPGVWFNAETKSCKATVDNIELYLEMMVDTPRGPKIAEQLKRWILKKGDGDGQQIN